MLHFTTHTGKPNKTLVKLGIKMRLSQRHIGSSV